MEINSTASAPNIVPPQKKSLSSKMANGKQWFKDCILGYEDLSMQYETELHRKMQVWIDLDNDIIDTSEIERVFNPMDLEHASFPAATKNYPISTPMIDLLQGEEANRNFEFVVKATNDDTDSTKNQDVMEMLMQIIVEEIKNQGYDEEKLKQRIQKFGKFVKYDLKSTAELTATRILEYLYKQQDMKMKFNIGFRKGPMLTGREIYRIDDEGDEPVVYVCDPRNVFVIRNGGSDYIEDAEAIIEIEYVPLSKVVDSFYDHLKPSEIDQLEQGVYRGETTSPNLGYKHLAPRIYSNLDFGDGPGFIDLSEFGANTERFGLPYDEDGNIRVVRTRWMSRRKIGILSFINPATGEMEEAVVSENFRPDKSLGQSVKWMWINEAMEGVHIADDIWVKMGPRKIQRRHLDNKSRAFLGYVGYDYGKSLMSRLEPYQYQYNIYMRKLELLMAKYKGPIYELDLAKIPDDWELDKWIYYAEVLGWAAIDNFNEAKKGAATGKLSGAFNTTGGRVMDAQLGNNIQQVVMFLQYIEQQMHEISGVTKQRLGNISNRETAQGVERSVTQSSHTTEKWFFPHDEVKKKVLNALLDTAKFMWAQKDSKKLNYILDDLSRVYLEFSPKEIAMTEFDTFVSNSSRDELAKSTLRGLVEPAISRGASLKLAIDVSRADSITQVAKLIETAEAETEAKNDQRAQADRDSMLQAKQIEADVKKAEMELKKYEIDVKAATDLEKARISAGFYDEPEEQVDSTEKAENDREKLNLEGDKLKETIRHNKATEEISKKKAVSKPATSK